MWFMRMKEDHMMNGFAKRYKKLPAKVVGDSGYGSEENYKYMENNDIEGFVKYPLFHKEQKKSFKTNAFLAQNPTNSTTGSDILEATR
ncbi:hypothetical protein AGMMS4957_19020 [Bacteroidia bacterium]|nr:hypothetical protein AGMMS4957_19020 [Bacteroidia bacterium]